ncbi:metalloprotease family protein [Clostridium sp.]|uniref:metalloprotease family protein n=1 Tax=Clostridium sp. TaxID=1506 RepID=UPI002FDECD07
MKKNNYYIPISNLSLKLFSKYLFYYFKGLIIVFLLISIATLIFSFGDKSSISLVIDYNVIFYMGIFMSTLIHEYSHLIFMKLFAVKNIKIDVSFFRFSLIAKENVKGKELLIISLAGALNCGIVASLLLVLNALVCHNKLFSIIIAIYYFHLINIIPCFGDGKMILKALTTT